MGKFSKRVLALLVACSLVLTTNAVFTFADSLNDERVETTVETTIEETTTEETTTEETTIEETTIEETTVGAATSSPDDETTVEETTIEEEPEEDTTTAEEPEEETTTVEETTVEETTLDETTLDETTTEDATVEETTVEETTVDETTIGTISEASKIKSEETPFGDGDNYTFKFKVPGPDDDPNPFGWFNSENGSRTIEYSSADVGTNPVVVPVFYPAAWSGGWTDPDWINVGWINESDGNNWISDDQLDTLVENWTANPTENITVRVNMSEIWSSNLKTPPTKTTYFEGEEIDPSGLVFEASDEITDPATWTKDIPYDEPQYKRLYSYQLLDESEAVISGNTVTAETKYCKFIYNTRNEQKVEIQVKTPHTFTFVTNEYYPDDFGWFDAEHTINIITYHSEQLDTHPIEIPLVYNIEYQDTGAWIDIGWLLYKGEHAPEEWISDDQLSTLVENWKNNPTEDVKVRVSFNPIYHSSLKQRPNKINYVVGEEIDPTGIIIEVSDQIFETDVPTWTKDIAYDAIQYKSLFAREMLDADKNSIGWDTVTANAKYCRFRFKTSVYEDVELNVTIPHTFKFVKDTKFKAWFNQEDGPTEITFKSQEITTNPIKIPKTYISNDEGGAITVVNVGWRNKTAGDKWISDDELNELVYSWSKNPNEDVEIAVNFDMIGEASVKTPPKKVDYFVGDEFDPSGLVMYLAGGYVDATWTVEVAYDAPEYQRIIGVQLFDNKGKKISGKTITKDTKFVRYIFNSGPSVDVNLNLLVPHTFTFEVSEALAHFNAEDGPTTIEFKSEELDTRAIRIPAVYMNESASSDIKINVGWINNSAGDKKITNAELEKIVAAWSKNPDDDVKITVNFETVQKSSVKVLPRVEYWVGDTFDPTELVLEVSDTNKTWTKNIPYDSPEFTRLYSYKLYDNNDQEMATDTITVDTKYCKFIYDNSITEKVDIRILKDVTEISIVKEQDWKEYSTGEKFDGKGLVIHAKYDDGEEEDVAYNDKRLLFLFDPFVLASDSSQVTVYFGGKTTTTHVTMVDKVYVLYYYNKNTNSVHSIYTYTGDENNVISALDNAVSSGAKGFYRMSANGFYDGYKKYNKNTERTLTKYEALSVYREEYDGNESIYIGAAFIEPPAPPTPTPPTPYNPGGSGGSSGGSDGSASRGPMGNLANNPLYQQQLQPGQVNTTNNIPQNNLIVNVQLAINLLSVPENANRPLSNVVDANGNAGFGRWQNVPGTSTWYFLSGDLAANGTLGTAGFVSSGIYNLAWGVSNGWYSFDAGGVMQIGWQQINGKLYYFEPNASSDYGKAATGTKIIDGKTFNFDANGSLVG